MTNQKITSPKAKKPIPDFASIQEEAEFWDTHDTTDYFEDEPIEVKFADDFKSVYVKGTKVRDALNRQLKQASQGITVRFQPDTLAELRRRAARKGIGATTLVRMLVLHGLEKDKNKAGSSEGNFHHK